MSNEKPLPAARTKQEYLRQREEQQVPLTHDAQTNGYDAQRQCDVGIVIAKPPSTKRRLQATAARAQTLAASAASRGKRALDAWERFDKRLATVQRIAMVAAAIIAVIALLWIIALRL